MENNNEWWRGAVLYQIYPRSFLDTNNDGIGDLPGITEKLDYIASLGVEGIWISPFFCSPMKDYGYDVSNYRDIDPMFGTLADFKALLKKAHKLGLKIIIDLVLSHTSDQHPWFRDPAKKDWYVWADARADGTPPNNWLSCFGGSAWEWSTQHHQYYLHNFLKEQPDLNFHNPEVQEEVLDIARFWLDMGVDGFRLDVVNFYFHDSLLRDNPPRISGTKYALQFEGDDPYSAQQHIFDKSRPENLEFLHRLRRVMDEYPDRFTVGEIGDDHPYARASEYTAGYKYLNTSYNTHLMGGTHKDLTPALIREPFETFAKEPGGGWPSWAFTNHDVVRAVSRWIEGGDGFSHDPEFAKMLIALLCCLRGTMFIYQGEELGLPEAKLAFEDLHDPWGIHLWPEWQGRDGCRTPIPWNKGPYAAFSGAKPWLPLPDSHHEMHVQSQEKDEDSVLHFTRAFLAWRKTQPALQLGEINFDYSLPDDLLGFTREYEGEKLYCLFNFSRNSHEIEARNWLYESVETPNKIAPYGIKIVRLSE